MDLHIDAECSISAVGAGQRMLSKEAKERLRKIPKTKCSVCDSKISYLNPVGRCFECGLRFCFDHLLAGLFKDGMSQNESLRDVCGECKLKYGYKQL